MKFKFIYTIILVLILGLGACTDGFEELNRHPSDPTTTTIEPVFNKLMSTILLGHQEQAGLHNTYYYYYSQQAGRFGISGYLLDASIDEIWKNYYDALADYRLLERLFEERQDILDLTNVKAMSLTLMAFKTLKMVEAFGDIPYHNAGKGTQGSQYFRREFDDDIEIYKKCLEDLKWASDNLADDENRFTVGTFDRVLQADVVKWKKWANSLILRHALRIYDVEQEFAGNLIAALLNDPASYPVVEEDENICLWPNELDIELDSRGWSFWSENMLRMGTAMWSQMSENNNTDGSGIFDPRCFVFFEPNDNNEWVPYPQNPGPTDTEFVGKAYKKDRDNDWDDKGGIRYSPFNYYLVRDINDIPEFIVLASEVKLLTAEAYAKGTGVSQNLTLAQQNYEAALRISVKFWYDIVDITEIWINHIPTRPTDAQIETFIAHPNVAWNNANALSLIYKQRWIDTFRQPWEGFHLWNYTRMTPRDITGNYNSNNYDFYRLHYSIREKSYNYENWSAATNDGANDRHNIKLFWHKQ